MSQNWVGIGTLLLVGCLRVLEPNLSPHQYKVLRIQKNRYSDLVVIFRRCKGMI